MGVLPRLRLVPFGRARITGEGLAGGLPRQETHDIDENCVGVSTQPWGRLLVKG